MREAEAVEVLKQLKDNYLKLDDLNKANAIQYALTRIKGDEVDLTTVYMWGVKEKDSDWRNKIKEKIQQIKIEEKTKSRGQQCSDRCLIKLEYESKENVLSELLKGE